MPTKAPTHKPFQCKRTREETGDDRRKSSTKRGYDRTWQRLRKMHLAKEPMCRYCTQNGRETLAGVVDHIIPHKGDLTLLRDPNNLQSLCTTCHNRTKQSYEKKGERMRWGEDGLPLPPPPAFPASASPDDDMGRGVKKLKKPHV